MIDQFIKYLTYEKRYSQHTLLAYREDLDQFFNYLFSNFQISDEQEIIHAHLRAWVVSLLERELTPCLCQSKNCNSQILFQISNFEGTSYKKPCLSDQTTQNQKKSSLFPSGNRNGQSVGQYWVRK